MLSKQVCPKFYENFSEQNCTNYQCSLIFFFFFFAQNKDRILSFQGSLRVSFPRKSYSQIVLVRQFQSATFFISETEMCLKIVDILQFN